MTEGVDETLLAVLDCVALALEEDGAPVCTAGATVGNPQIANCCDCDNAQGELWGNMLRIYRADSSTYEETQQRKPCSPSQWVGEFQLTLARCFPAIDEVGELPSVAERTERANMLHADVAAVTRAINCCDTGDRPHLARIMVDAPPSGGCSYLIAVVQVPVSIAGRRNQRTTTF